MQFEINQNASIDAFKESLYSNIIKAFELKEWKKYQNFKVYVSYKGFGNNICIVQPEIFGCLPEIYNPCIFASLLVFRKTYKIFKEDVFNHFVKYCK